MITSQPASCRSTALTQKLGKSRSKSHKVRKGRKLEAVLFAKEADEGSGQTRAALFIIIMIVPLEHN